MREEGKAAIQVEDQTEGGGPRKYRTGKLTEAIHVEKQIKGVGPRQVEGKENAAIRAEDTEGRAETIQKV